VYGRIRFRPRLVPTSKGPSHPQARSDPDQFRRVMLPHIDDAYNFARYLSRDSATAEDIVQDAFLRAFRGFERWRGDNPKAWLFVIVRNCYLDWATSRRDPLRGAEPIEAIDDDPTIMAEAEQLEERTAQGSDIVALRRTIENLPEPFRETLVLRELEELSYKEIATITNVPIGTVMSRLARARQMLATVLLPANRGKAQA
jgi:RNA polymerase sigma factor (sigma-70 family)